ncbi:helix-turn-helix transcriptional regulator, partial [Vibrio diabolicus]
YQNIVEFSGNNVSLTNILSNKWIIYDVPKEIGEKALAEMQLMHFLNLKGLIYQDAPIEHFTRCLKTVSDEDLWLPRKVMTQMLFEIRPYALNLQVTQASTNLTKREIQIFKRLIKGASNLEISEDLFIAESTVKTHLYNIYKKMNVNNRKQAIKKARFIYDYSSYNSSKH